MADDRSTEPKARRKEKRENTADATQVEMVLHKFPLRYSADDRKDWRKKAAPDHDAGPCHANLP